jgi:Flp pilus assembly protein TadG
MNEIRRRWTRETQPDENGSRRLERGQSLIIVVFAFMGILALVGLSIDLGLVYVERVRAGRAADATALAAVAELPLEQAAQMRARDYLRDNGYDPDGANTRVVINPGADDEVVTGPDEVDAITVIWIDTAFSRDTSTPFPTNLNTSDRIRITIKKQVRMTFLQFIGWHQLPVQASAEAENISNLDVVIVYDHSGSMEFDTLCYECWVPHGAPGELPGGNPCTQDDGCIFPLQWAQSPTSPPATPNHCAGWDRATGTFNCGSYTSTGAPSGYQKNNCNYRNTSTGRLYFVIEAEEYSSYSELADYHDRETAGTACRAALFPPPGLTTSSMCRPRPPTTSGCGDRAAGGVEGQITTSSGGWTAPSWGKRMASPKAQATTALPRAVGVGGGSA